MGRQQQPRPRTGPWQPEPPAAPPTVVSWEMDYGYDFPVVDASPGAARVGEVDATVLGLSQDLARRLTEWAHQWEVLAGRRLRSEVHRAQLAREEAALDQEQRQLVQELRRELDPGIELLVEGVPLIEWFQTLHRR